MTANKTEKDSNEISTETLNENYDFYGINDDTLNNFANIYKNTFSNIGPSKTLEDDTQIQNFPRLDNLGIDNFKYYSTLNFNKKMHEENIKENDLKILNLNVRGINKNYGNINAYLASIKLKFHIIVLSECHLLQDETNEDLHNKYPLTGYQMYYVKSKILYGGVIIYINEAINQNVTYIRDLTTTNDTCDSLYLNLKINKTNTIIAGYYRHCRAKKNDKINFINILDSHLKNKKIINKKVILAGDMNICLMRSSENPEAVMYLNTLIENQLECHTFKPTRIVHYKNSLQVKSATLIDQTWSNYYEYECISGNLMYEESDHFPNFVILKNLLETKKITAKKQFFRRQYEKIDDEKLESDLNNINWTDLVENENNIEKCFENIIEQTDQLLNKHAPLTKISHRKAKHVFFKPWIDNKLIAEIRQKNKLFKKQKKLNNEINKTAYKTQKNKVTNLTRHKKQKYFSEYFIKYKQDTRKMWDGINLALEQTRKKKSLPNTIYDTENNPVTKSQDKADCFAKYFESVPKNTRKKITPTNKKFWDYFKKSSPNQNYLELYDCTATEIAEFLLELKTNSSSGPIQIPNLFIKKIAHQICYPLANAINKSLKAGYFPNILKLGKQTPVFKSGEHNVKNFRPITVCNSFAKILEKVVRNRLTDFLKNSKILNKYQFGFRAGHSTSHAIINLFEATLDGLDTKLKVGGVYLDISKAFDCVDHNILLKKLEYYGIRANALMWFESYLQNRKQYVEINGTKSEPYTTNISVPQGGVLSAILFILFTNDIIYSTNKLKFSIYADDTCLIISIEREEYDSTLKRELKNVIEWFDANSLLLNVDKTQYTFFGPQYPTQYIKGEHDLTDLHQTVPRHLIENQEQNYDGPTPEFLNKYGELQELHEITPKYYLDEFIMNDDGTIITTSETVKYLGMYIDSKLNFKYHINILSCKISRMTGIFWKSIELDMNTKKIIYHSLVESYLNYGILIWCSEFSKTLITDGNESLIPNSLKPIITAQNKALRAIFRKPKYNSEQKIYTESSPLYKELKVLKIKDLYLYNLAILTHDYFNNLNFPDTLKDTYSTQKSEKTTQTRSLNYNLTYKKPKNYNTYRKPTIASSIYWNSLPIEIKNTKSKSTFKIKLKQYLLQKY